MRNLGKIALAPLIVVLAFALVPLLLIALICWCVATLAASVAVWLLWIPRGVRFLVVYSDSAQWKNYFEKDVLPVLGSSARAINLSRGGGRKGAGYLGWCIYKHGAGYRNRFPIAFRFSPFQRWETIRFYDAFMEAKKGKTENLIKAKNALLFWAERNRSD